MNDVRSYRRDTAVLITSSAHIDQALEQCTLWVRAVRLILLTDYCDQRNDQMKDIPVMRLENASILCLTRSQVDCAILWGEELLEDAAQATEAVKEMGLPLLFAHGNGDTVQVLSPGLFRAGMAERIAKRIFDIIFGFAGCLLTAVIALILIPVIRLSSPGAAFFAQKRVGRNGKIFTMYKFRSMYNDAEQRKADYAQQNEMKDGMMFKLLNDPRMIGNDHGRGDGKPHGLGYFLRRTSIDELPQFWNVLIGDMSLVGPRPPTIDEWEKYSPHHRSRVCVKPGMTGLWQVSGRSEITDFEQVLKLDTDYIKSWSLKENVSILFKTVAVVLNRRGAA